MSDKILEGNITGALTTQVSGQPFVFNFLITNKTGGNVTLNIQIFDGNQYVSIAPLNLQLAANSSYGDQGFYLQAEEQIVISTSGSCDYYIDFTPTT